MGDISNLTAEIETFVRAHDNDQEQLRESPVKSPLKKKDKSPPIPPARTTSHTTTVINQTSNDDAVAYSQTTVTIEQVPIQTVTSDVRNHSVEVHQQVETKIAEREKIPSNETLREDTEHGKLIDRKSRESPENNEDYPERTSHTPDIEHGKIRKSNSEKQLNVNNNVEVERNVEVEVAMQSPPRIIVRKPTEDWEYDEEIRLNDDANHANGEESPKTPISSEVEFILEHDISARASPSTSTSTQKRDSEAIVVETVREASSSLNDAKEKPKISTKKNFKNSLEESSAKKHEFILKPTPEVDVSELKIVESTEDLTNAPTVSQSSDKYKIRFVALKNFSPEPLRRDIELRPHNKQEFDVEDIDLPPAPPQRRRSVKDIIASINKSQSLLKMNQQPNGNVEAKRSYNYETYLPQTIPTAIKEPSQSQQPQSSNESIIRKYNELEESERKIRKMITDMEQSSIDVPVPVVEKFDEFIVDGDKSDDLFKKCVVRRDKSLQSGASQEENRSSMEWNPLPKPRRSRNLTHELENGKI